MIINLKSPLLWIFIIGLLTFIVATACLSLAKRNHGHAGGGKKNLRYKSEIF